MERRASVPGGEVRHRDAVPAPRLRGVRPQGVSGDPPVRQHQRPPRSVDYPGIRQRGLPLRALDARREHQPVRAPGRVARCGGKPTSTNTGTPNPLAGNAGDGGRRPSRPQRHRPHPGLHEPDRVREPRCQTQRARSPSARQSDRQRDRRVRHRTLRMQPPRSAPRPRRAQYRPRPGRRHSRRSTCCATRSTRPRRTPRSSLTTAGATSGTFSSTRRR